MSNKTTTNLKSIKDSIKVHGTLKEAIMDFLEKTWGGSKWEGTHSKEVDLFTLDKATLESSSVMGALEDVYGTHDDSEVWLYLPSDNVSYDRLQAISVWCQSKGITLLTSLDNIISKIDRT